LAIWTLIVFVLLLAVLYKFAWGPISQALDLREKKIADNIAAAEDANREAKRMLADYEAQLAGAYEKVRGIMEEARRDAETTAKQIEADAHARAAADIERGKHEIETATAQALKELAETSANLAVDLAGRIVSAKLNPADHANLITQALSKFPKESAGHN
jgi:F-type H+-transporting ATPase subunit b